MLKNIATIFVSLVCTDNSKSEFFISIWNFIFWEFYFCPKNIEKIKNVAIFDGAQIKQVKKKKLPAEQIPKSMWVILSYSHFYTCKLSKALTKPLLKDGKNHSAKCASTVFPQLAGGKSISIFRPF